MTAAIPVLDSYHLPADPIANRVSWQIESPRAALLIHDMQDYFLSKYDISRPPVPDLIKHITQLRQQCKQLDIPVFYTAQITQQPPQERGLQSDFWGPGLSAPQHHHLASITSALQTDDSDIVLTKRRYSAFQRSDLLQRMQTAGRDQLIITGIYASIGCLATALEAFMHDIQVFFVSDATADYTLEKHRMAIHHVAHCCGVSISCSALRQMLANPSLAARTF